MKNYYFSGCSSGSGFTISCWKEKIDIKIVEFQTTNYRPNPSLTIWKKIALYSLTFFASVIILSKISLFSSEHILSSIILMLLQGILLIMSLFILFFVIFSRFFYCAGFLGWHGCEHKVVSLLEKGLLVTENNLRKRFRAKIRCGTTYAMITCFSLLIFAVLPSLYKFLYVFWGGNIILIVWTLVAIIIAELPSSLIFQYLFTTKEPKDGQIKEGLIIAERIKMRLMETDKILHSN